MEAMKWWSLLSTCNFQLLLRTDHLPPKPNLLWLFETEVMSISGHFLLCERSNSLKGTPNGHIFDLQMNLRRPLVAIKVPT